MKDHKVLLFKYLRSAEQTWIQSRCYVTHSGI